MTDALLSALEGHHKLKPFWPHSPYWFCMAEEIPQPTIDDIKIAVCKYYGVTKSDLNSNRRGKAGRARQEAMYLCYRLTDHSHSVIGRCFKKCDHTVSLHAYKRVLALVASNEEVAVNISRLEAMFA
jgi:chromosomal replication initiation ATPase DnaA